MSLFSELKRRKVFRTALAYVVMAWLLLQVTDVMIPIVEYPAWVGKLVFFFLLAGLPVVLVLAWVFARKELYGPVIEALENHVDEVRQVYLVASEQTLAERLSNRGDEKLEYSLSRLRLINELPFAKLVTDDLSPEQVAHALVLMIMDHPD